MKKLKTFFNYRVTETERARIETEFDQITLKLAADIADKYERESSVENVDDCDDAWQIVGPDASDIRPLIDYAFKSFATWARHETWRDR